MLMLSPTVKVIQCIVQFRSPRLFQPAGSEPLGSTLVFFPDSIRHNLVDSSIINSDTSRTLKVRSTVNIWLLAMNNIVISHRTIHYKLFQGQCITYKISMINLQLYCPLHELFASSFTNVALHCTTNIRV